MSVNFPAEFITIGKIGPAYYPGGLVFALKLFLDVSDNVQRTGTDRIRDRNASLRRNCLRQRID